MPDYNYSIFKLIRIKNGLEALRLARSFERETLAIARFKSHLNFNHRLKENRVLLDSLRFNPPIKCKEGYDIAKKAGLAYLRLRIKNCHIQIHRFRYKLEKFHSDLQQTLDVHSMDMLMCTVEHTATFEWKRKSLIRQDKLQRLLYNRSDNHLEDPTGKWVVNISSKPFSDLDKKSIEPWFQVCDHSEVCSCCRNHIIGRVRDKTSTTPVSKFHLSQDYFDLEKWQTLAPSQHDKR